MLLEPYIICLHKPSRSLLVWSPNAGTMLVVRYLMSKVPYLSSTEPISIVIAQFGCKAVPQDLTELQGFCIKL
jgi:hypothetical protein